VTQKFILIQPPDPKASVILFPGGHGILGLSGANSMKWGERNFLVRTREDFVKNGLMVAVVDAPSDHRTPNSMIHFRTKEEHTVDIERVIAYLKDKASVPVWIVGTSRGTLSAASVAHRTREPIDGLVLTASMDMVAELPMFNINVPSLVVHHKKDRCKVTRPESVKDIAEKLKAYSSHVELIYFEGGLWPKSSSCNALSQHGFYGIERKVVDAICTFIKSN
jgi:pimeloyl-ACP methyl ester carboxylesterase